MTLNLDRNSDWVNFLKCLKVSRTAKNLLRFTVIIRQHFVYHAILAKITIQFVAEILRKNRQNVIEKNKENLLLSKLRSFRYLKYRISEEIISSLSVRRQEKCWTWLNQQLVFFLFKSMYVHAYMHDLWKYFKNMIENK